MAIDSDDPISLPKAPPPRPAARRAAIETALRKFDGIDEPTAASVRPTRFGWASVHRRPIGALVTAAVVAAISIPLALVTLRELPQAEAPPQVPPAAVQPAPPAQAEQAAPAFDPPQKAEDIAAAEPPPAPAELAPPAPPARRNAMNLRAAEEQKAVAETPAPLVAAPAPPPPPPPAPPAPAPQYAAESDAADMVVTGSRIQAPAAKQSRDESSRIASRNSSSEEDSAQFLSRLQSALRAE